MREEVKKIIQEKSKGIYDALVADVSFMRLVRPENTIPDIHSAFLEKVDLLILDKLIPESPKSDNDLYIYNIMCDDDAERQAWTSKIFNDLIAAHYH